MYRYRIFSKKTKKEYIKVFSDIDTCKEWVENNLDLSMNWNIEIVS